MNYTGKLPHQFIDTLSGLKTVGTALSKTEILAVDLEADSLYHYKEKVCLIQLATPQISVIIDPLNIESISLLKPVFENPKIQKIIHGADYDVRSLYRDFQTSINNLFDTELASRFLGIRETGLEAVIQDRFNIQLDKRFQKKDWSIRPLPEEMIEYAVRDVWYLKPLAEVLQKELKKKGRFSWVEEECYHLSRVRPPPENSEPLYLRFKGAGRLAPRSLAVLEELLQFRDRIAERKDKPLFRILRNETVKKIALMKTTDAEFIKHQKVLSRKQVAMYGSAIEEAVNRALSLPESLLPVYPHLPPPVQKPKIRKRIRALKIWRDRKAKALGLESGFIINKALMIALAEKKPKNCEELNQIPNMRIWQRQTFGKELLEIIN